MSWPDPRWQMPTNYQEESGENPDDRGREPPPPRPYRNLALALGSLFGLVCGCVLAVYLGLNVARLKGILGVLIGFPVGVGAGSAIGYFVLLKLADFLARRRKAR